MCAEDSLAFEDSSCNSAWQNLLVTYLERNKVFTFPSSGNGLKLLEEQCRKEFKFESSLEVTFQRLEVDHDWGEIYIDLDEDSTINHKDRLKAVVTPVLTTPKNFSEVCTIKFLEVHRFILMLFTFRCGCLLDFPQRKRLYSANL